MKIKCPNCNETFDLSENEVAEIIKQVRNAEFTAEIDDYKERLAKEKEDALKMAELEADKRLKAALTEAKEKTQETIDELKEQLLNLRAESKTAVSEALTKQEAKLNATIVKSQAEVTALKAKLDAVESEKKLAVTEAVTELEKKHYELVRAKDLEIEEQKREVEYYKDFKAKQSTKAIGESLEKYCKTEYDMRMRPMIPDAYFEKDNVISETGSKGDYIFREEQQGVELLSIMFEMKNEMETTAGKHRNEDFLKELDKDRREKNCEYAVLVSMLEADSEYYNQGIVDMSYRYPKMFVIRPQFMLPLISLLRNAALASHKSKVELEAMKEQNIDVTHFEDDLADFKAKFARSCELTGKSFKKAIEQIDKAINDLQSVKDALTNSEKHLIAADNKLEDLSIEKLTKKNPTMRAKFEEARLGNSGQE